MQVIILIRNFLTMKKNLLFALVVISIKLFATIPTSGLVGAWPFNGNANDVSGSGNNGTVSGATLVNDRCGNNFSAYSFDGINDFIQMINPGPTGDLSRSVSFWVKTTNNVMSIQSIFDYGTPNNNGGSYQVCWNYCNWGVGIDNSCRQFSAGNTAGCWMYGTWHHVVLVFDKSVSILYNSVVVYVDGVVQSIMCLSGTGPNLNIATGTANPITIGRSAGGSTRFFNGIIDDIYLYNRAITPSEVQQLYTDLSCSPFIAGNSTVNSCSPTSFSIAPISGGFYYTWSLPAGWLGTSSTNVINVIPNTNSGVITVTVQNFCLQTIGIYTLAVTSIPQGPIVMNGPTSICPNTSNIYWVSGVNGATSYNWTLPSGWLGSPIANANNITSGTTGGIINSNGIDGCGNPFSVSLNVTLLPPINVSASDVTLCLNASACTVITANSTFGAGPVTYTWFPGNLVGQNQNVCPTSTTIYTVTASSTAPGGCAGSTTMAVITTSDCCTQTTVGLTVLPTNPAGTYSGGSYLINSNVTLNNSTNFQNAEFLIMPNVQITVPPTFNLNLNNVHLYSCGGLMWKGIVIQDGGSISSNRSRYSLIEDAEVAIDLDGITSAHATPPISLHNITFNKNYIGIKISNSSPNVNYLPIHLNSCVFSSRNMIFTSSTWPNPTNALGGLRYAAPATPTTGLIPPYPLLSFAPITLKTPCNFAMAPQQAHIGIKIENIGNVNASAPSPGVDIGVSYGLSVNQFNLFDELGIGIEVTDASLTTANNVFQNMNYYTTLNGPFGGKGIKHRVNSLMNARLDLRPVPGNQAIDYGNRFWNCYDGVSTKNVYEVLAEYIIVRSNHASNSTSYGPGAVGIILEGNRFKYDIKYSQFNNIAYATWINSNIANYDMGSGIVNGIYADGINISENYYGARVNSTAALGTAYMSYAINVNGPNSSNYQSPSGNNCNILGNKIDRAYRGISINSMYDYPVTVGGNLIYLLDDVTFGLQQYGIKAYDNQGNLGIRENTLSSVPSGNPLVSLVHCLNNNGVGSPLVKCNVVSDGYYGFEFEGPNNNTIWEANWMTNNWAGLLLNNNGVIGTQGSSGFPNANKWWGSTWAPAGPWNTLCIGSDANLSPLWANSSGPISFPPFNGGGFVPYDPLIGSSNLFPTTGDIDCLGGGFPTPPNWRTMSQTAASENITLQNEWKLEIFPNPSNGNITIQSPLENESMRIRITDITGRVIYYSTITTANNKFSLDLPTDQSIYFIEISNSNNVTVHKKIIVSK